MKRKTQIIIVAIILLAVTVFIFAVYLLTPALMNDKSNIGTDVKSETETQTAYTKDISQGLEIYNSPNMRLTAETVEVTDVLYETPTRVIELTAEILPICAANKSVIWSVEWDYPTSLNEPYDPSQYVSVEPLTDKPATARIYATQEFYERIRVIATSEENSEATAYCKVDYARRLSKYTDIYVEEYYGLLDSRYIHNDSEGSSYNSVFEPLEIEELEFPQYGFMYNREYVFEPDYTSGTVSSSFENIVMKIKPSDVLYNTLKAKGLAKETNDWTVIGSSGYVTEFYNGLCNQEVISSAYETVNFDLCKLFNSAIIETPLGEYDFEIFISAESEYNSREYRFLCEFNRESDVFNATDAELNEEIVIL